MGFRAAFDGPNPAEKSPLAEIRSEFKTIDGTQVLDLVARTPSLFPYFYAFVLSLADMIQVDAVPVPQAVDRALDQWHSLLRRAAMLSDEEQTGLAGELWMLDRLADGSPSASLAAWTGPGGEAHDFRLGINEFEIKSTRGERRIHSITTLSQLVPSPAHDLFIVSIQFAAAGAIGGESLRDKIVRIREHLDFVGLGSAFDDVLQRRYGITPETTEYYRERIQLRTDPVLVRVTDDLPSLRRSDLDAIDRPGMERVLDVRYRLDLSGLGWPDGSPDFLAIIPKANSEP